VRRLPIDQWAVLIREHHPGFIDWAAFEMNQARLANNTHPGPHQAGGAVREGSALLQGLATCGRCGRHLRVYYQGKNSTPGYYCASDRVLNGRGTWCLRVGGVRVDRAVVETFLEAISPAGLEAAIVAQNLGEAQDQNALKQFRLQAERARYEAERAERRFRNVEPENRLVARTLETEWENKLHDQRAAEAELARKEQEQKIAAYRSATGADSCLRERFENGFGTRRPRRTGIEKNCCAACWKKLKSMCCLTKAKRIWCCAGRPAPCPNWTCCGEVQTGSDPNG